MNAYFSDNPLLVVAKGQREQAQRTCLMLVNRLEENVRQQAILHREHGEIIKRLKEAADRKQALDRTIEVFGGGDGI